MLGDRSTLISPSYIAWQILKGENRMKAELRTKAQGESYYGTIPASQMEVGEVGVVIDHKLYKNHILLRVYNKVVSLTDPNTYWTTDCNLRVRHLNIDEEVVLS